MNRTQKHEAVQELKEKLQDKNFVLAGFQGLDVCGIEDLRRKLRAESYDFKVVKNTLLGIALKELNVQGLDDQLTQTTAVAVQKGDSLSGFKILSDFMKDHASFKVKAGVVEGQVLDADGVKRIASLPSKEVLIAQLLSRMQAPMSKLVYALKFPINQVVYALNAVKESKGSK